MKKILFIFFLFLLILPIKKEELQEVFYEESISYYELYLDKCNITTNNILEKIDGNIIKKIYPHIDKSYSNILKYDLDYYDVKDINNLDEFVNNYKKLLRKIGKNSLVNIVNFRGVPIEKIIVYDSFRSINKLLYKNQCIKLT